MYRIGRDQRCDDYYRPIRLEIAVGLADRALPAEIATSLTLLAMTWKGDVGNVPNRVSPAA